MKIPPSVLFTSVVQPNMPASRLSVRVDTVILVERTMAQFETPVAKGISTRDAKNQIEATVLHLSTGGRTFVEESVEFVHQELERAKRRGWLW